MELNLSPMQVLIMCGLPGSGKSTLAEELLERYGKASDLAEAWYRGDPGVILVALVSRWGVVGVHFLGSEVGVVHDDEGPLAVEFASKLRLALQVSATNLIRDVAVLSVGTDEVVVGREGDPRPLRSRRCFLPPAAQRARH